MAVMTSSAFDKTALDLKATAVPSAEAMALDAEPNGVHNVLFDDADQDQPDKSSQPPPTTNGNHEHASTSPPLPDMDPTTNESTAVEGEGVSQPTADNQADNSSLFEGSELGATSTAQAVEAPISDVRDEARPDPAELATDATVVDSITTQATEESTQQVPETQIDAKGEPDDEMEISQDAPQSSDAPAKTEGAPTKPMHDLTIQTQQTATTTTTPPQGLTESPNNLDHEMEDAPASGKVRPREDDDEEAPDAKRTKTDDEESKPDFKVPEVPAHTEQTNGNATTPTPQHDPSGVQSAVSYMEWSNIPLTTPQIKFLQERIRNTKKIKVSQAFKEPVDVVALNIPQYPEIVKSPMDLATMESKLKSEKYKNITEFMSDLDQIIENTFLFNGPSHPVTQNGYNMRAYFLKGMQKMPTGSEAEPAKPAKAKKPTITTNTTKPRRESRAAAPNTAKSPVAPPPSATTPQTAWPLGQDGLPLIRRDSSTANDRPKREIHRPPPKDLPYSTAKPRKKKYQQELKFCESVISELLKPKYSKFAYPFMTPVDPVALNIPSYLKIIKKPMDFGTIEKNLKAGQYQSAKDFYNDAQLVFQNCFKFNPDGDEVNKMGKQTQELFDSLWKEKADWLAQHAPASDAQSPASDNSDEDDEEEEAEDEENPEQAQFLAIQRQIAELNQTAQALLQQQKGKKPSPKAAAKKKAAKPAQPKKKNNAPLSVPPPVKTGKAKARPKAPAPLSFAQKQEISDGISTLGDAEMRKAVQIIRNGCPELATVNDDEMELDMEEINEDTLRELFKFIKSVKGPKQAVTDDDYDPPKLQKQPAASKAKKNKPMGKVEQEDQFRKIKEKLDSFNNEAASGSSQSPPANHEESSDDDDDSGSESEEE